MRSKSPIAAAGLSVMMATMACAMTADPLVQPPEGLPMAKVIAFRREHMEEMFKAFEAVYAEMLKDAPDMALIRADTLKMKTLAASIPSWFPEGSGPEAGVPTRAKPVIWVDRADVAKHEDAVRVETGKLHDLAVADDLPAMVDRFGRVSEACAACHDIYRGPRIPH